MTTTYKATGELRCWKQHSCAGCGSLYRYRLSRKIAGTGLSPEAAQQALRRMIEIVAKQAVDQRACPYCGLFQPEMLRSQRGTIYACMTALMVLAPLAAFYARELLSGSQTAWLLSGCAAVALVGNLLALANNPNRNPQATLKDAQKQREAGELVLDKPGLLASAGFVPVAEPGSPKRWLAMGLLLLSVLGAAAPELLRTVRHWEFDPSLTPPLVGAGESFRYTLPQKIDSVAGYWGGSVTCTWVNAEELGVREPCKASVPRGTWGASITSLGTASHRVSPWVDIILPKEPALEGKTGRFQVNLQLRYPKTYDSRTFGEVQDSAAQAFSVTFLSPGANSTYQTVWWVGVLGSAVAGELGCILLLLSTLGRRSALPTRVFPLET